MTDKDDVLWRGNFVRVSIIRPCHRTKTMRPYLLIVPIVRVIRVIRISPPLVRLRDGQYECYRRHCLTISLPLGISSSRFPSLIYSTLEKHLDHLAPSTS